MAETAPEPRKGMPSPELSEAVFKARFRGQFQDPAFAPLGSRLTPPRMK